MSPHSNWPRVLLFDLAHKQCNDIIKGWLHYLTSESTGRFFVNNVWLRMSGHGANPIFFNEKKIGRPEHSLNLHLLRPIISHFYPPSKWTTYIYHPLSQNDSPIFFSRKNWILRKSNLTFFALIIEWLKYRGLYWNK